MLPFALSISILSLVQAALVAVAKPARAPLLTRLRSDWWALVPPLSIAVVVAAIATVSEVGNAAGPVGVTLTGANLHVVPAGIPPVHAKVIVE